MTGRYARELAATREALARPIDGMPSRALDLAELERLVRLYPEEARQLIERPPKVPRTVP